MTLRRALLAVGLGGLALAGYVGRHLSAAPSATAPSAPMPGSIGPGYIGPTGDDTLRVRLSGVRDGERGTRAGLGAIVSGYLSPRGLPPIAGSLVVTDTGLVFRSADGAFSTTLPVVGPVRQSPQGWWRASAVTLGYVDDALGRPSYLFRVEGGVFETDAPGGLIDIAEHPRWLDSLRSREWTSDRVLVSAADTAAVDALLAAITHGSYADTLYAIFGRPTHQVGVVGPHGRSAGRLGEYVTTRDSLALDPGRMTSVVQLRHTLAHELAHRWQAHSGVQLGILWQGIPAIRDPKRYGFDNPGEHQAEAAAFAVHFLLATASVPGNRAGAGMLDHYDLLVPGTRTMARFFAMQPEFTHHPLRRTLLAERRE